MNFTIEKSTVECYKIRSASGGYWADITIDAAGTTGRISISSDYGNWSNYWGACGCDFKSFLGQIGFDYAADKFEVKQVVDVASSAQWWKEMLFERRRCDDVSAEDARFIYDEILEIEKEPARFIMEALVQTAYLVHFLDEHTDEGYFCETNEPRFVRFWNEIWPVLLAEFAREREAVAA